MYIYLNINNLIISQAELSDFTLDILGNFADDFKLLDFWMLDFYF